jgi:hypothetical protein
VAGTDEVLAALFATIDGQTMLITGDRWGSLCKWKLTKPRCSMLHLRPYSRLRLIKAVRGEASITALAHHPRQPLAIARSDSIEFNQQRIQLDPEVTAITFAAPDTLVVATKTRTRLPSRQPLTLAVHMADALACLTR